MTNGSNINWTKHNWNPTVGCSKVSPGCKHCYAERMAYRLQRMNMPGYERGFELTLLPKRLNIPLKRKKPTIYFVNSMSDLFHENVPFEYIAQVFDVIEKAYWHTFQILTKRPDRMAHYVNENKLPNNVWLGVTVENREHGIPRIDLLRKIKCSVRFLSIEPLLEDIGKLDLHAIHWVIVGGESGPKARKIDLTWVDSIREQCELSNVPFFFHQWGRWGEDGVPRSQKENGRKLHGRTWDEMPFIEVPLIREMV